VRVVFTCLKEIGIGVDRKVTKVKTDLVLSPLLKKN